ncbi:MAG: choice-of-anchor D domain-containing protein [Alphaproteobacteria bacterium]
MKLYLALFVFHTFLIIGVQVSYAQYPGFDAPGTRTSGRGAVGLVPVESQVNGGSIPIGATGQVVVLFRNEGAQPVQTGKINLYPSSTVSAHVSLNQCANEPLLSGAECAVAVSIKGLQSGPWRLEMLMLHSGRSRLVTSTLSGSIDSSGDSSDKLTSDVETIPDEIDFGSLGTSQTMIESVILRNITSNPIDVSEVLISAADSAGYSVDHECTRLDAGQACIATVKWIPKQKGPATGVLIVRHSGPTGLANVSLNGDYDPDEIEEAEIFPEAVPGRGLLVSSQTEIDFGDDISSASTITVSLVNTGDSPLALEDIIISGSDNGLSLNGKGCSPGLVLEPIEACPLTLTWSPTRIGTLLDDIQVLHDGARGILVLPARGEAQSVVSQDQKAIVLTNAPAPTKVISRDDVTQKDAASISGTSSPSTPPTPSRQNVVNASSALDGLKITSFAATRAIVNGPGGSRLLFDGEPVMLGGIMWDVDIQKNGIEFASGADRILLLFDRSLSSVNRVSGQLSSGNTSSSSSGSDG